MKSTSPYRSEGVSARTSPTIWYMGSKTRVLSEMLAGVLADEVPGQGTVLDLFSGTGVVAAHCARRYRTIANDVQEFSRVIASSLIEHPPQECEQFLGALDFDDDLLATYLDNRTALEKLYAPALRAEKTFIDVLANQPGRRRRRSRNPKLQKALAQYRAFLELPGSVYGTDSSPTPTKTLHGGARDLIGEDSIAAYRARPTRRPACLVTAYYANIYFGLRQSIEIDSLRAAIDAIDPDSAFAPQKRTHYLSALIHTASVSTSGTSHFAQPRHLRKDSEVLAMAQRRGRDIVETFLDFDNQIRETVANTRFRDGNRAVGGDYVDLLVQNDTAPRFADDVRADLVYMDPPYTADNYSRFYHVLEVLTRYDYPELERDRDGVILRGRYPRITDRFRSGFCSPTTVEAEFERVIRAAAGSGSKLVISYGSPGGLLLKMYTKREPEGDAIGTLRALCQRHYREVVIHTRRLTHSGQGDVCIPSDELLFVCRAPR